jgi:hypothetical protein
MLRAVVIAALIAAGLCSVAHADVYRWVDDKGQPHYTDRWVPGSQLISSSRPHASATPDSSSSSSDTNKAVNAANQHTDDKADAKKNADAAKADAAKLSQEQCKQAKARRIYKPAQPGDTDRNFMSDAESDAYRAQARSDVTVACGSPPPAVTVPESSSPSEKPE